MILRGENLGESFGVWEQALAAPDNADTTLKVARSTIAQLGGDVLARDHSFLTHDQNDVPSIHIPVEFAAYTSTAQKMFDDLRELIPATKPGEAVTHNGRVIPIGRIILLSMLRELDGEQIQQNILDGFMGFDETRHPDPEAPKNYQITSAGRLLVKLAEREYRFDEEELFETAAGPLSTLHEGRPRLERVATAERRSPDDPLPDFTLSGIRVSPGSLHLGLESRTYRDDLTCGTFDQIYGGHFIDAGRIAGIGRQLKSYNRHRQVELRRVAPDKEGVPPQTYGNTWLGVKVYEPLNKMQGPHDWLRMTPDERREIHITGISTLRAIEAEDPITHEALLEAVKTKNTEAIILKRSGGIIVNKRRSRGDNERAILRAFRKFPDGLPEEIEHLAPQVEALDAAGDKTNLLVTDEMDLSLIPHYVKRRGVSAFLFNRSNCGEIMDINDMTTLSALVRSGVGIAKLDQDSHYREFHQSGLWVKPGVAKQLLHREDAFAFFGANRGPVGEAYREDIDWLLDQAIFEIGGTAGISVVTGGGGGIMQAGHLSARERGVLSLVASITSEKPEVAHLAQDADALNQVISLYLLMRQDILEQLYTIAYVYDGGHGTGLEIFNATTARKLQHRLPTPIIVMNNRGFYKGIKQQLNDIADHTTIMHNGEVFDVSGRANSPRKWNLVHFANTKEDMFAAYQQFRRDPLAIWHDMGMTEDQIGLALDHNLKLADMFALNIPSYLLRAAQEGSGRRPR
jgi:predicted Rossmann-fold nucleotide-binding protein